MTALVAPVIQSLLGDAPTLTLADANDPNVSVSVRLVRVGGTWLGVVDDRAALLERVRVGAVPRFFSETVFGEASVKLRGRATDAQAFRAGEQHAHKVLVDDQPFGVHAAVVIEVAPLSVQPANGADEPRGALPRT